MLLGYEFGYLKMFFCCFFPKLRTFLGSCFLTLKFIVLGPFLFSSSSWALNLFISFSGSLIFPLEKWSALSCGNHIVWLLVGMIFIN